MGKRRNDPAEDLGLEAFGEPPPDEPGLSLDELSQAYASLLDQGDDPYQEAVDAEAAVGPPEPAWEEDEPEEETAPEESPEASDELDHEAACPVTPRSILEAMLFVGHPDNEPLTSEKVASYMRGVRPQEIEGLVGELNRTYDEDGCPYRVESAGPGYRLQLREEFSSLRDKFYGRIRAARLSQAAIDVLAIVAYKQPLTRDEIDALRGKPSGGILGQLVRRELLRLERTADNPRRPRYHTTDRFLALFGLENLQDLPRSTD
jgi:segregation and condensation protein B